MPNRKTEARDPDLIKRIGLDAEAEPDVTGAGDGPGGFDDALLRALNAVQDELEQTRTELEAERSRNDSDAIKAQMMKPYADKTFVFVCIYCAAALLLVMGQAFAVFGFELDTTVLSIITGSTAVSVIGLVGIVVGGLFRPK